MTGKQAATHKYISDARPDVKFATDEVGDAVFMRAENYPTIKIGRMGGVDLVEIRTYPNALKAAVEGDTLLAKQNARDAKGKAVATPETKEQLEKQIADATAKLAALNTPAEQTESSN